MAPFSSLLLAQLQPLQEGILVLRCFQLLADVLNQVQNLEQVLVSSFPKQIEVMLKAMAESKVGLC